MFVLTRAWWIVDYRQILTELFELIKTVTSYKSLGDSIH